MTKDIYQTIAEPSEGEFKDRGSKFIAYAFPAYSEEDVKKAQTEVRKLHPKARHHCFAWRLGTDGNSYRANDDGEPSGTAGRPILGQIDSFGLTNVIVIVIRYFGGTLLGASGLINAYKSSTYEALNIAKIIEKTVEDIYQITFDYALMSNVMNAVKKLDLEMVSQDFGEIGRLQIAIKQGDVAEKMLQLKARIADVRIEEAEDLEEIEGCEMEYVLTR